MWNRGEADLANLEECRDYEGKRVNSLAILSKGTLRFLDLHGGKGSTQVGRRRPPLATRREIWQISYGEDVPVSPGEKHHCVWKSRRDHESLIEGGGGERKSARSLGEKGGGGYLEKSSVDERGVDQFSKNWWGCRGS